MSAPPPSKPPPRGARRRVGLIVALVALAIAGAMAWRRAAPPPETQQQEAAVPAPTPTRLPDIPSDYAAFFAALAARFPTEAAQIADSFAARSADDPAATPDAYLAAALKHLRETRGVVAAKADAPAMAAVFEAQGAMIAALRGADPKLCVDFVYGGATDAFMAFVATHRPLFAAVAKASLDAILDGAEKRIARDAPGDAEFAVLEKALRDKGLGDVELAALLDGKTPDPPLPDERMCEATAAYVASVLALPEPARTRLLALAIELMARG